MNRLQKFLWRVLGYTSAYPATQEDMTIWWKDQLAQQRAWVEKAMVDQQARIAEYMMKVHQQESPLDINAASVYMMAAICKDYEFTEYAAERAVSLAKALKIELEKQ